MKDLKNIDISSLRIYEIHCLLTKKNYDIPNVQYLRAGKGSKVF